MTDFETPKQRIWDDARQNKRELFDKDCEILMEKAAQDIWRIGWNIAPKDINDVYRLLDDIAKWCHERWVEAMECGDAPPEDVSPGEGFVRIKQIIQEAIQEGGNDSKGA